MAASDPILHFPLNLQQVMQNSDLLAAASHHPGYANGKSSPAASTSSTSSSVGGCGGQTTSSVGAAAAASDAASSILNDQTNLSLISTMKIELDRLTFDTIEELKSKFSVWCRKFNQRFISKCDGNRARFQCHFGPQNKRSGIKCPVFAAFRKKNGRILRSFHVNHNHPMDDAWLSQNLPSQLNGSAKKSSPNAKVKPTIDNSSLTERKPVSVKPALTSCTSTTDNGEMERATAELMTAVNFLNGMITPVNGVKQPKMTQQQQVATKQLQQRKAATATVLHRRSPVEEQRQKQDILIDHPIVSQLESEKVVLPFPYAHYLEVCYRVCISCGTAMSDEIPLEQFQSHVRACEARHRCAECDLEFESASHLLQHNALCHPIISKRKNFTPLPVDPKKPRLTVA